MKQAMYERHMVRKYLDKPIPQECREKIEQHTRMLNDEYGVDSALFSITPRLSMQPSSSFLQKAYETTSSSQDLKVLI